MNVEATAEVHDLSIDEFDVKRHNGAVTITNPATGQHRTFRIRTAQGGKLKGSRIVELLTGPDNTSDYQGFAFVADTGDVRVWSRFRGPYRDQPSAWDKYALMLMRPRAYADKHGLIYQIEGRCRRCNRLLTDGESIARGLGAYCYGKIA